MATHPPASPFHSPTLRFHCVPSHIREAILLSAVIGLTFFTLRQEFWRISSGDVKLIGRNFSLPRANWEANSRRKIQSFEKDKWIVAVTSVSPTDSLVAMASLPDWQLLVLGDSSTPPDWNVESAIYLNETAQKYLDYRICRTPFQGRNVHLNIGYLFAIEHGAKIIYTAHDKSQPLSLDLDTAFRVNSKGSKTISDLLVYPSSENRKTVNPFVHFGQPSMWPRGFPWESVASNQREKYYHTGHGLNVLIRQGLTNGNPDSLDAFFRFTRASRGAQINVTFDSCAQPVGVGTGTMVPIFSHNTMFYRDAFWAMVLPVGISHRIADVLRGYWAQRLLSDINGNVAYFPPTTIQDVIEEPTVEDLQIESHLFTRTGELIQFLLEWNSSAKGNLFDRAVELSAEMASRGFWTETDSTFMVSWLSDLTSVRYSFPSLPLFPKDRVDMNSKRGSYIICGSEVVIRSFPSTHLDIPKTNYPPTPLSTCPAGLDIHLKGAAIPEEMDFKAEEERKKHVCPSIAVIPSQESQDEYSSKLPVYIPPTVITYVPTADEIAALETWRASFKDVVLIINYNFPKYKRSVKFLRAIYSRLFEKIHVLSPQGSTKWGVENVANAGKGWLSYRSLPGVFSQYPKARGFLLINDDLLLNYWNFVGADKDKIWFPKEVVLIDMTVMKPFSGDWSYRPFVYKPLMEVLANISRSYVDRFNMYLAKALPGPPGTKPNAILKTLSTPPPVRGYVKWIADTFYIPMRLTPSISELVPYFADVKMRSEVAIPMMLYSTENPDHWDPNALQDVLYIWGKQNRSRPLTTYTTDVYGYHPWKISDAKQMSLILEAMAKGDPTLKALSCSICHLERAH